MSYTTTDFEESLKQTIPASDVARVSKHCDRCAEKNRLRMQAHRANTGAA